MTRLLPLSRKFCRCATVFIVLSFVFLALWPFHWNPPRDVVNGAVKTDQGTIRIDSEGTVAFEPSTGWLQPAIADDRFEVKLRVRPFADSGPIFNFSNWDGWSRNVLLEQQGSDLVVPLRTPTSTINGSPSFLVKDVFSKNQWSDIELLIDSGKAKISVNGQHALEMTISVPTIASWQTDFHHHVRLGNEMGGSRPWLGEIAICQIKSGSDEHDLLHSRFVSISDRYSVNLKVNGRLSLEEWQDCLANFVCFIPLGFFLYRSMDYKCAGLIAIMACSTISGVIELLQFPFDRLPSVTDWVMNSAGGAIGAMLAQWNPKRSWWLLSYVPVTASILKSHGSEKPTLKEC